MLRTLHLLPLLLLVSACSVKSGLGGLPGSSAGGGSSPTSLSATDGGGGAAHRDAKGRLVYPGGDLSSEKAECSSARNHCLRSTAWFVGDPFNEEGARAGRSYGARAVFEFEGGWWNWMTTPEPKPGPAYRTASADAGNVEVGELVVYFVDRYTTIPRNEDEAHFSAKWSMGYVTGVAGSTLQVGTAEVALETARLVVETR